MEAIPLIGLTAAFCTTAAFVPQVLQILKSGNVEGISLTMYSIFTLGVALWLTYALVINDLPMMIANLLTLILATSVLALTVRARIFSNRNPYSAPESAPPENTTC